MNKKIYPLNLEHLKNGQHFDFNDIVVKAIILFALQDGTYKKYIKAYRQAFDYENEVYKKFDRKYLTSLNNAAVQVRDSEFRIMRDQLRVLLIENEGALKTDAEKILSAIELYGGGVDIPQKGNAEKTGIYTNLIEDLETKYADEVETTGISTLFAKFKAANETCQQTMQDRSMADSELGKDAMAIARVQVDKYYRAMVSVMNADMLLGETELYPFADYLNVEIDRFRIFLGQGVAGANKPGGEEGGEGEVGGGEGQLPPSVPGGGGGEGGGSDSEQTPDRQVTLTFETSDHRKFTRKGRPGDKYRMPTGLKTGEIWVNEFGQIGMATGVYPDTDMEFFAMPDSLPKVTYHFSNGAHEIFTGEPETPYIIPVTTPGYVWMPEPNGLIPAQSQQYFEILSSTSGEGGEENEDQTGEEEEDETFDPASFTPGMPWPADKPAPEGFTKVDFEYHTGQTVTKLYRQGATIISQGNMPEPTEGYTWVGIYMILNTESYTVTEEEE